MTDCENSPRQACPFVLAREIPLLVRDRNARTGAFREQWAAPPRSLGQEPGRRSSEGPPSGAIPVPAVARLELLPTAQARGRTGRERASWGTYTAARGAWRRHYLICEALFRRSAPSSKARRTKKAL